MNPDIYRVGLLMEQAMSVMSATLTGKLREKGIDLPHSQYCVLRCVYGLEAPVVQSKIAATLHKDAAAIKRTIDILERKGLVRREAISGRANTVVATEKALEIKDVIIKTAQSAISELLSDYSASELDTLNHILKKIAGLL